VETINQIADALFATIGGASTAVTAAARSVGTGAVTTPATVVVRRAATGAGNTHRTVCVGSATHGVDLGGEAALTRDLPWISELG
jgi:hypothetical protein